MLDKIHLLEIIADYDEQIEMCEDILIELLKEYKEEHVIAYTQIKNARNRKQACIDAFSLILKSETNGKG